MKLHTSAECEAAGYGIASWAEHPYGLFVHAFHEIAVRQRPFAARYANLASNELESCGFQRLFVPVRCLDGHWGIGGCVRRQNDLYYPDVLVEILRNGTEKEEQRLVRAFHASPNLRAFALRFVKISGRRSLP